VRRATTRSSRFGTRGLPPVVATGTGAGLVVALAVIGAMSRHTIGRPGQVALLLIPIVVAAVLGGRYVACAVAVLAALALSLMMPPAGSPRVHLHDDLAALVIFAAVALTMALLVARRVEALQVLERQRAALLRAVSHDLRTPLGTIQATLSELAGTTPIPEDDRRRLAAAAHDEAERLGRLVADLLSLARIDAGAFIPRYQAVDLAEIVHDAQRRLDRVLPAQHLRVVVEGDAAVVRADHAMLDQAVVNLLENAARHRPDGTDVTVRLRSEPSGVELVVADEGPGIPEDDLERVFEPYRSGALPGAQGLGLATCRAVVVAHGGEISAGNAPGGGAVFTLRLPRA
jgi:two-component system sensor histidine kinase KdpD